MFVPIVDYKEKNRHFSWYFSWYRDTILIPMFNKKIFPIILLLIASSFVLNKSLIYSQNNMMFNKHWHSYKQNFLYSYAGGIESIVSRSLLARSRFLVNKNLGHQLILSNQSMSLEELIFKVKIESNGYIDIIFNSSDKSFEAIRVSNSNLFPTIIYESDFTGKFISSKNLNLPQLDQTLHIIHLKNEAGRIALYINNNKVTVLNKSFQDSHFGFYTSLQNLEIFKVIAKSKKLEIIEMPFSLDEDNNSFLYKNFLIITFTLLAMSTFYFFIFRKNFLHFLMRSSLFIFFISILWLSFDFFYYSNIHHVWNYQTYTFKSLGSPIIDLEQIRYRFFSKWYVFLGGIEINEKTLNASQVHYTHTLDIRYCSIEKCLTIKKSPQNKIESIKRFLYIGASFSANAGITTFEHSYFDKLSSELINLFNRKSTKVEIYNLSYPGIIFEEKLEELKSKVIEFNPDYLIFSIHINHEGIKAFNEFLSFLNKRNITPIYIFPIINPELVTSSNQALTYENFLGPDEAELKDFIALNSSGINYFSFDANQLALDHKILNKGLLWWDMGHMTPFGQELLGEMISQKISELIK